MSFANWFKSFTIQAKEDMDTEQYQAVALDDGKVANTGAEAIGILQNKPKANEHATVGFFGIMKYRAGGAIAARGKITVTTSGYCIAVGSGYHTVGSALVAVTSGSIGTGLFNFADPRYCFTSDHIV